MWSFKELFFLHEIHFPRGLGPSRSSWSSGSSRTDRIERWTRLLRLTRRPRTNRTPRSSRKRWPTRKIRSTWRAGWFQLYIFCKKQLRKCAQWRHIHFQGMFGPKGDQGETGLPGEEGGIGPPGLPGPPVISSYFNTTLYLFKKAILFFNIVNNFCRVFQWRQDISAVATV